MGIIPWKSGVSAGGSFNLKGVSGIQLVAKLEPSKVEEACFDQVVKATYDDERLTETQKKNCLNSVIGMWGKKHNQAWSLFLSTDESDVNTMRNDYGVPS